MLGREHRVRTGAEFQRIMRAGVRSGRQHLVLFAHPTDSPQQPERVGFIVSKAVGNAVTRNKVKRRLREIMRAQFTQRKQSNSQPRCEIVVQARPLSATATFQQLADDVQSSLVAVEKKLRSARQQHG